MVSSSGIAIVAMVAILTVIGKVFEKYFPESEPTFESGAGAPAPGRDATIDALYYRSLVDSEALDRYIDENKPAGYEIVDHMVLNDLKWNVAVDELTAQRRSERLAIVKDVREKYQLAA